MIYSVVPKVYKPDYDFIISNYLDKSLWGREWNIYVYLDHIFSISLQLIDISDMSIRFVVKHTKKCYTCTNYFYYFLNNPEYNINVLKKQINGSIYRLMVQYLEREVRNSPEYEHINNVYDKELFVLKGIAESRCKDAGIYNADVVDNYISLLQDQSIVYDLRAQYVDLKKYMIDTDLLLLFCNSINDEIRLKNVQLMAEQTDELDELLYRLKEVENNINAGTYSNELPGL